MIITRFLRRLGFMVWTEAELIEALTPPSQPTEAQVVDVDRMIRSEK